MKPPTQALRELKQGMSLLITNAPQEAVAGLDAGRNRPCTHCPGKEIEAARWAAPALAPGISDGSFCFPCLMEYSHRASTPDQAWMWPVWHELSQFATAAHSQQPLPGYLVSHHPQREMQMASWRWGFSPCSKCSDPLCGLWGIIRTWGRWGAYWLLQPGFLESPSSEPNPCLFSLSGFQPFGQRRLKIIEAADNKVPGTLAFAPPLAAAGSPSTQRPERRKCQGVGRHALGINIEGQSLFLGSWAKFSLLSVAGPQCVIVLSLKGHRAAPEWTWCGLHLAE